MPSIRFRAIAPASMMSAFRPSPPLAFPSKGVTTSGPLSPSAPPSRGCPTAEEALHGGPRREELGVYWRPRLAVQQPKLRARHVPLGVKALVRPRAASPSKRALDARRIRPRSRAGAKSCPGNAACAWARPNVVIAPLVFERGNVGQPWGCSTSCSTPETSRPQ
eukprot:scaffold1928_cov381-Prasinococcus_capsulatus_cf.AAC.29